MKDRETSDKNFAALRKKAEQVLSGKTHRPEADGQDFLSLLEEVELQRIELELQNAELRQANQRLEESRNRLFEFAEFAPVAILNVNAEGLIEYCNEAASRLLSPPPTPNTIILKESAFRGWCIQMIATPILSI